MPIHACTATVLLIAYCHAHLGRLPPATTRICRVRTHSVAACNFRESPVSRDTLPSSCGSDAHHVGPSQRATAFIFEAQLLLYRLERAWYRNDAQSGRDLHLASSLPELVSPFDLPRWLLPPASRTVSHRGKPPPRCPPHHPMQPSRQQSPRTRMHQPSQIFISPLPLGGPIVDERMWRHLRTPLRDPPGTARQSCCIVPPRTESRKVRTTVPARLGPDRLRQAAPHRKMAFVETALCRGSCVAHG